MPCSICARTDVDQINSALDAGRSYREIEEAFAVSHGTLSRHNVHRQEGAGADDPDEAIAALLTSIRDAIAPTYQEQITAAQQELAAAQERLEQARQQLQDATAQAWACAARVSQAKELAPYKPFKNPGGLTPRSVKDQHLHPYWDTLTTRQTALEQACVTLDRAVFEHDNAAGVVRSRTATVQRLEQELVGHLDRLDQPATLELATELTTLETTLAALTGVTPAHRQPLLDQAASLWHQLRIGTPPPRRLPEPVPPPAYWAGGSVRQQRQYDQELYNARQAAQQMDAMVQRYAQARAARSITPTPA